MTSSPRHRLIAVLACRYARNRMASVRGVNAAFGRLGFAGNVSRYMRDWLDEHGELPTGEHQLTGKLGASHVSPGFTVDFDRLLADPRYPQPR